MTMTSPAPGTARSPGVSYQELLDGDSRPENVPAVLRWQSNHNKELTGVVNASMRAALHV